MRGTPATATSYRQVTALQTTVVTVVMVVMVVADKGLNLQSSELLLCQYHQGKFFFKSLFVCFVYFKPAIDLYFKYKKNGLEYTYTLFSSNYSSNKRSQM